MSAEVLDARADFLAEMLTDRCSVRRGVKSGRVDGAGGQLPQVTMVEESLGCRVGASITDGFQDQGGRNTSTGQVRVRLIALDGRAPSALDVQPRDVIDVVGGESYRVITTDTGRPDALCLDVVAVGIQP